MKTDTLIYVGVGAVLLMALLKRKTVVVPNYYSSGYQPGYIAPTNTGSLVLPIISTAGMLLKNILNNTGSNNVDTAPIIDSSTSQNSVDQLLQVTDSNSLANTIVPVTSSQVPSPDNSDLDQYFTDFYQN